jgi:hypothetical protein
LSWKYVWRGFERISVTWRAYGGCWVLTWQVSPFWGLPVSPCTLLASVDSLTSRLNGEEGVGWGLGGCARALRVFGRRPSLPVVYNLKKQ